MCYDAFWAEAELVGELEVQSKEILFDKEVVVQKKNAVLKKMDKAKAEHNKQGVHVQQKCCSLSIEIYI